MELGEHVSDYSKIDNNIFIGSDLCKGLYCPMHSEEFKRLGISAEINLEVERNEQPTTGVEIYLWLPTIDDTCPTTDQLTVGTTMIDQICKSMKKVYVHCRNGHGRSPTLVVAYFVRFRHMTVSQAVDVVKIKRPEIHLNQLQMDGIMEFEKLWS
jgi:dual specificity MAP kinase phosphatase